MSIIKVLLSFVYRLYFPYKKSKINNNRYDKVMTLYKPYAISGVEHYDTTLFSYNDEILRILNPSQLTTPYAKIKIKGKDMIIGIQCWLSGKYTLVYKGQTKSRPLYLDTNEYIYWESGKLYCKKNHLPTEELCKFELTDFMYCDMLHCEDYYVIRTGGKICISKDLCNWNTIYQGKRGIKDSMVFVGKNKTLALLFIEYSPGTKRSRHNILKYHFENEFLEIVHTFYTYSEFSDGVGETCARHIHVIAKDPYTNDIYVGTGDNDEESGIFVSTNDGNSFTKILNGSQNYRALSFLFTKNYVYWNTDTHETQAIFQMEKQNTQNIVRFPLINGALWCSAKYPTKVENEDFYIMTSNSEGSLYDNNNRVYGITLKNDKPQIYELLTRRSRTQYSQHFLLGFDNKHNVILYDHEIGKVICFQLIKT